MTTIFWDEETKTLYADSRTGRYEGGASVEELTNSSKIVTMAADDHIPWEGKSKILAMAGAGDLRAIDWLIQKTIQHGFDVDEVINNQIKRDLPPMFLPSKGVVNLLVVTDQGSFDIEFHLQRSNAVTIYKTQTQYGIGSGEPALRLALDFFGLASEDAMRFATLADPFSGGDIHSISIFDGLIVENPPIATDQPSAEFNRIKAIIAALPDKEVKSGQRYLYGANPKVKSLALRKSTHVKKEQTEKPDERE